LEGALVIFSELIGAKMLGSFYGASLTVWTAVISVTITFLTLGYFIGGKFSTSKSNVTILKNCFALAAFFIIVMPIWSETLFITFNEASLVSDAIKTTIFLIGPSVFCLGISSPIIIQLLSEQEGETGNVSGKVYAISTFAGILATLLLGYVLLPSFGLKTPLFIAAILLITISFYIKTTIFNILLGIVVLGFGFISVFKDNIDIKYHKTHYESEGLMGQLKVIDQDYNGNNIHFRLLFINGIPQTVIFNQNKEGNSFWEYVHRFSAIASLKQGQEALLFGMGGGAIANELQKQNFNLDIVDIDKRMFEISQNYFYFKPKPTTSFTIDDARHYIKTCQKKYDLILLDICSGEVQPSNVFTKEGIAELKKILNKDGIILVQYQEKINPTLISGSQSIAKTLQFNGFKTYQNVENLEVASIIIAASPIEIPFNKLDTNKMTLNVKNQKWLKEFVKEPFQPINKPLKNSILLEDDKPILEKLNAETIELWRKSTMKYYGLKFLKEK
jgi:spermidine synthase